MQPPVELSEYTQDVRRVQAEHSKLSMDGSYQCTVIRNDNCGIIHMEAWHYNTMVRTVSKNSNRQLINGMTNPKKTSRDSEIVNALTTWCFFQAQTLKPFNYIN